MKDALRTPDHGPEGSGEANLRLPTGGLANGMPQNVSTNFPVEFIVWPEISNLSSAYMKTHAYLLAVCEFRIQKLSSQSTSERWHNAKTFTCRL